MLSEQPGVYVRPGERARRLFRDEYFELWLWYDDPRHLFGFQLVYDVGHNERALTWTRLAGFSHARIDSGEGDPLANRSPLLTADAVFDWRNVRRRFERASAGLAAPIRAAVVERLTAYVQGEDRMRLFYTPNSPYARICRVLALERGLGHEVKFEEVTLRDPASALLPFNPSGKVPALETSDGHVLAETRIVCEHLDTIGPARALLVAGDLDQRQLEGRAINMLDGIAVWLRELRRPEKERSPGVIALEAQRAVRCLDRFERDMPRIASGPEVTLGTISLACTIGFADCFLRRLAWREGRPGLTAWYEHFVQRASMAQTMPRR